MYRTGILGSRSDDVETSRRLLCSEVSGSLFVVVFTINIVRFEKGIRLLARQKMIWEGVPHGGKVLPTGSFSFLFR